MFDNLAIGSTSNQFHSQPCQPCQPCQQSGTNPPTMTMLPNELTLDLVHLDVFCNDLRASTRTSPTFSNLCIPIYTSTAVSADAGDIKPFEQYFLRIIPRVGCNVISVEPAPSPLCHLKMVAASALRYHLLFLIVSLKLAPHFAGNVLQWQWHWHWRPCFSFFYLLTNTARVAFVFDVAIAFTKVYFFFYWAGA